MTKEQIAELRRAFGEPLEPESWHDGKVLRLLDEREALLEALRAVSVSVPSSEMPALAQVRAAISRAEAP